MNEEIQAGKKLMKVSNTEPMHRKHRKLTCEEFELLRLGLANKELQLLAAQELFESRGIITRYEMKFCSRIFVHPENQQSQPEYQPENRL